MWANLKQGTTPWRLLLIYLLLAVGGIVLSDRFLFAVTFAHKALLELASARAWTIALGSAALLYVLTWVGMRALRDADSARRHVEARYRDLIEVLPHGVIETNRDGTVRLTNSALAKVAERLQLPDGQRRLAEALRGFFRELADTPDAETGTGQVRIDGLGENDRLLQIDWRRLSPTARQQGGFVACVTDVTDDHRNRQRLDFLAHRDPLTGLANRNLLLKRLRATLAEAGRARRPVTLIHIDLDDFKRINGHFGHGLGDRALDAAARRLAAALPEGGTIARIAGDEFLVLVDGLGLEEGSALARRMRNALHEPLDIDGEVITATASIGVAACTPTGSDEETGLLQGAAEAMLEAKRAGGNVCRIYSPRLQRELGERGGRLSLLRRALKTEEPVLHYQPRVDLVSDRIAGMEAVLRLPLPEASGFAEAREFLPLIEDRASVDRLGKWMLRQAATQLRQWQDEGIDVGKLAVRLPGSTFRDRHLAPSIEELIIEAGLDAERLQLEVTEDEMVRRPSQIARVAWQLRAVGVDLGIADFGHGAVPLTCLHRVPFTHVLFDGSAVVASAPEGGGLHAIGSLAGIGTALGADVVVRGVDSLVLLSAVGQSDCKLWQGDYRAPAMPAAEATALLHAQLGSAKVSVLRRPPPGA